MSVSVSVRAASVSERVCLELAVPSEEERVSGAPRFSRGTAEAQCVRSWQVGDIRRDER